MTTSFEFDPLFPHDEFVDVDLTAFLHGTAAVPARLLYQRADPWAVTLLLECGADGEREWLFSRDLLTEGMLYPAGDGDVRISPEDATVWITLSAPGGSAALEFSRAGLERALDAIEGLVPGGTESVFFDWDREWALFTGEDA
jgi:hypothetical protein